MKRKPIIILIVALAGVLLAQTGTAQTAMKVSPERLARYWLLTNRSVDVMVPNMGRGLSKPGCAAVSYTIGADGVTRDIVVRKVVPSTSDFASMATSVIRQFHYAPGADNAIQRPVSTYYIVPMNLPKAPAERERITNACALPGY